MVLLFFIRIFTIPLMLQQLLTTPYCICCSSALVVLFSGYNMQLGAIFHLYISVVNILLLQNLIRPFQPLLVTLPSRFLVLVPL